MVRWRRSIRIDTAPGGTTATRSYYRLDVHPIERLRYVARATHVPADVLARETAMALADFVGDDAGLLIACKRILDRQPTSAPLVWLIAHALGAPNQRTALWQAVEDLERDQTNAALAYSLPDDSMVAVIGWSDAISQLARKRGDVGFVVVDTDGNADYQIDRLLDHFDDDWGQRVTTVDAEGTAQALIEASHLLVPFDALGPSHGLAPLGSFAASAVAQHLELPVWGIASLGVALGERMYDGLIRRWHDSTNEPLTMRTVEEVPVALVNQVVSPGGLTDPDQAIRSGGCPIVAELY